MPFMPVDQIGALRSKINDQQAALDSLMTVVEGQGIIIVALLEALEELTGSPVLGKKVTPISSRTQI
jgi:hypothetical protein